MSKENLTPQVKTDWLEKLPTEVPDIKFEINILESFIN